MPRAPKRCARHHCDDVATTGSYCPTHEAERQRLLAAQRGTTTQRGYGAPHQRLRKQWEPLVNAGHVTCWRCGERIAPGTDWDLGHDDHDRTTTRGPEHAHRCNRSAAGRGVGKP